MLNTYLHPDHTPVQAREAAQAHLKVATSRLNELVVELTAFIEGDEAYLAEHGDEYASHESSKSTLFQKVEGATRDMARIQTDLIGAVAAAARA